MKFLTLFAAILFAANGFSKSSKFSSKPFYTFSYNLVPQKDNSHCNQTSAFVQNDSLIINGKVIDEVLGDPVPFAYIYFIAKKYSINLITASHANGEFRIAIPGRFSGRKISISIRYPGYETKTITYKRKQFPLLYQTIKFKRSITHLD